MSFRTFKLDECPNTPVAVVESEKSEWLPLGLGKIRILEDGSHTGLPDLSKRNPDDLDMYLPSLADNRLGMAEFWIPANAQHGPPPHWHMMHDETFYVTKV